MKLSQYGELLYILNKLEIPYSEWDNPEFIDENSVALGAVRSVSIMDAAHIDFDGNGDVVGASTDCARSWVKLKRGKK